MGTVDTPPMGITGSSQLSQRVRKLKKKDKKTSKLIKEEESDEEYKDYSLVPDKAKALEPGEGQDFGYADPNKDEEEEEVTFPETDANLIHPSVALVAPDCTPKAFDPLDASHLPLPSALDVILGKDTAPKKEEPAAQKAGVPSSAALEAAADRLVRSVLTESSGVSGDELLKQGAPMPAPAPASNGSSVLNAMRKFIPKMVETRTSI